jgi:hypothetical protein
VARSSHGRARSRRVFEFIEEHVTKGLGLARLAEVTAQAFKLATDWSPHRIGPSASAWRQADRESVADRAGFTNFNHFRACSDSGSGCCRRRPPKHARASPDISHYQLGAGHLTRQTGRLG